MRTELKNSLLAYQESWCARWKMMYACLGVIMGAWSAGHQHNARNVSKVRPREWCSGGTSRQRATNAAAACLSSIIGDTHDEESTGTLPHGAFPRDVSRAADRENG